MFTTYILYSKELAKFYIGFTGDDMSERLYQHLSHHKGFTSKAKDWEVVYTETFEMKKDAMGRERQLKGWKSNTRLKELIKRSSSTE